jgi:hypothetical protein
MGCSATGGGAGGGAVRGGGGGGGAGGGGLGVAHAVNNAVAAIADACVQVLNCRMIRSPDGAYVRRAAVKLAHLYHIVILIKAEIVATCCGRQCVGYGQGRA